MWGILTPRRNSDSRPVSLVLRLLGLTTLVFLVNFLTLLVLGGGVREARSQAASVPPSYDLNGDGVENLADSVWLLGRLVSGGGVAHATEVSLSIEEIELLRAILPHLSVVDLDDGFGSARKTIRFTGVNVQIVDGSGKTEGPPHTRYRGWSSTGLGNLILGYNEPRPWKGAVNLRQGSHNLVIGSQLNYDGVGGIIAGLGNSVSGLYSVALGGAGNRALGDYSVTIGGSRNTASAGYSTALGGSGNSAEAASGTCIGAPVRQGVP